MTDDGKTTETQTEKVMSPGRQLLLLARLKDEQVAGLAAEGAAERAFTTVECRAILGSVPRRSIHQSCLLWDRCAKIEKRASQALGAVVCAPVRVVPLGGIAVPGVACGPWRTSWAVKIGAGRHGGAYCGPGGGLRVG